MKKPMSLCVECEKEFTPNAQVSTLMCLNCAINVNTMIIRRYTKYDGSVTHRKLLKRKQMLLGLREKIPHYKGAELFNQKCLSCGIEFVTRASFKARLRYCNDCQKLRLTLQAVREVGAEGGE